MNIEELEEQALQTENNVPALEENLLKRNTQTRTENQIMKRRINLFKAFSKARNVSNHFIITTIFTSNFIGIAFARTLHYQFYVWYFHTIPYLLWHAVTIPVIARFIVFLSVEIAFNVYPATWWSSLLLQVSEENTELIL